MSSSSQHTFDQAKISHLRNSADSEIDLTDLVHTADLPDLSGYLTSGDLPSLSGYLLSSSAATTYSTPSSVSSAISTALTNYPPYWDISAVTNRRQSASYVQTTDDTPTPIMTLSMANPNTCTLYDVIVLGKSHGAGFADKEAFSSKFSILATRDDADVVAYQLVNGEQIVSQYGAVGFEVSHALDGNNIIISATGATGKTFRWLGLSYRDFVTVTA